MRRITDSAKIIAVAIILLVTCSVLFCVGVHAGTCAWMPSYGPMNGVTCTPANELVECRCSECFQWDPVEDAISYTIQRTDESGTLHTMVLLEWIDQINDTLVRPATVYCPAKMDDAMPRESKRYIYRVFACNGGGCGPWSTPITYVAAPYAINSFRPPRLDNPR